MEQNYISDNIFKQIKDFNFRILTEEQELIINKLILKEELKECYKKYGLCDECKQPNTGNIWCHSCNAKRFQQNFKNWTSENSNIDKLIQESQINAQNNWKKLEWIENDRLENIEYVAKGGFGMIYKAIWKDGWIYSWNHVTSKWNRDERNTIFALKCLNNSTLEFLDEVNILLINL
ncbi:kinase-like domain-containing protein [Rhizophagus irregularis DAOM 181602=DAOM 197198]|nr:kinase-like domain-containing protein [Rhizophagus irregularis DAOM 181602=DAOM 197198]